jgi:SWI/SNF-related matrix-associated actin-dependent regulator 1 of chromatin subfamily A
MAIKYSNKTSHSIKKFLEPPFAGKHPKLNSKDANAVAAAEAAVTAAGAIAVEDIEEAKRLAAEFEAFGGGALTMALAQEAEPGDPLRDCWLARKRLRASETLSISRAEFLTARTDAATEAAEAIAAEAAAAEATAAVEADAAAETTAVAGAAAKAAADEPGAQAALAPKLQKRPGVGAGGMAEDAEETPGRPVCRVGAREELKTQAGCSAARKQTRQARPRDRHRSKFSDQVSTVMR